MACRRAWAFVPRLHCSCAGLHRNEYGGTRLHGAAWPRPLPRGQAIYRSTDEECASDFSQGPGPNNWLIGRNGPVQRQLESTVDSIDNGMGQVLQGKPPPPAVLATVGGKRVCIPWCCSRPGAKDCKLRNKGDIMRVMALVSLAAMICASSAWAGRSANFA